VCTFTNERRPASIAVSKTVGTDPNVCATTTAISTTASTTVYFCITLHNTGQIPLHTHLIEDPTLGLSESVVAELAPNTSRSFTHNDFAELAVLVTEDLVNNATVTSSSAVSDAVSSEAEPVTATSVGTATVDVTDPTNDDPTNEPDLPNKLHLPLIGNE
jgi:hypothetical protein